MRMQSSLTHLFRISCPPPAAPMAASTSHCCFTSPSVTPPQHTSMKKTHMNNPPPKFLKLPPNPVQPLDTKLVNKRRDLKDALEWLSNVRNSESLNFCPEEVYGPVIDLCASMKALSQGEQLHALMVKTCCFDESSFLDNKLVYMYSKCGSTVDAEKVFDNMSERTTFTWNVMIGACVSRGDALAALRIYREMRILGFHVDAYSFPGLLKACGALRDLQIGAEIHGVAVKCGYESTVFVSNSLVSMYAKCDDLDAARKLFDRINVRADPVSWNSIISAYSVSGKSMEALGLFRDMQRYGAAANAYTLVSALQACEDSSFKKLGMAIHGVVFKSDYMLDTYVLNALIAMYVRCGKMTEASRIFCQMPEKDRVSWNSMITGLVQNSMYSEAIQFFRDMQDCNKQPDEVSVASVLAASGRLNSLSIGMESHVYALKFGMDSNLHVGNSLIDMYAKCCCTDYMGRAFRMMPDADIISWTTIICGYAQNGSHVEALQLFREVQIKEIEVDGLMIGSVLLACRGLKCMSQLKEVHCYILRRGLYDLVIQNTIVDVYGECGNLDYTARAFESIEFKDVVSWTSMISSYARNGLANEALKLFYRMQQKHIEPDSVILVCLLSAIASLSVLRKGKEVHGYVVRNGFDLEGSIANSLLDMYARCGALENAQSVFNCTQKKGLVQWTSMINAYGLHGRGKAAVDLFSKMQHENVVPDNITFLALLYACSHRGLADEGKRYLEVMEKECNLEPWPEHYACLVDLLGRANRLEEAYKFVKNMKTRPSAEVWCALLAACRAHSNKELGEIAAQKLLELDPKNPGNYVLVSNVFAASGRWKEVETVRTRMKESGMKKNPGCSWIEIGQKVHSFTARDKSHPETNLIYQQLTDIICKLERETGYIADTKSVLHNVDEEEKVKIFYGHSERLAIAYGLLKTPEGTPLRITKNLRVCGDCHAFCKLVSKVFNRELVVRDANRFHHLENGKCSCRDFW